MQEFASLIYRKITIVRTPLMLRCLSMYSHGSLPIRFSPTAVGLEVLHRRCGAGRVMFTIDKEGLAHRTF